MEGEIRRDGKSVRPSFSYKEIGRTFELSQCELLESNRNVMEAVLGELKRLNSLLHCCNFLSIPPSLRKIARNTAPKKKKKVLMEDPKSVRILASEPALISGDAILVAALKGLKKGRESASTTAALDEFVSQLVVSAAKAHEGESA